MRQGRGTVGWGVWLAGLAAYAATLALNLPATLIDARLEQATDGSARLAEAQGTVWSGAGYLEVRGKDRRISHAHPLSWRLLPSALLRGRIAFELELGRDKQPAPLTFGWAGIELSDASITLPAAALGLAVPPLSPLELRGELLLHIARLVINGDRITGRARLDWRHAGSALTTVFPLGDYQWDIHGDNAGTHVVMRTLQGPLQLEGKGSWTAGTPPAFQGNARVPVPLQQQLVPLLRLIAVEQSPGSFAIQIR